MEKHEDLILSNKNRIFSVNDRKLSANDRILERDRILYMIVYFTNQSTKDLNWSLKISESLK